MNSDTLRTLFCSFRPHNGAEVLDRFTDGEPAAVLNAFGKGKAVVTGYPIGREFFLSDLYHLHYGNNWADQPNGSWFSQGLMRYFELLLPKLGFQRNTRVVEEIVPRSGSMDASWPSLFMPRAMQEYRDYVWMHGDARRDPPRSVEVIRRGREGNPTGYLLVYNRESGYGQSPGVVHFEAGSKQVKIELEQAGVRHLYDISLGCPVPITAGPGNTIAFSTMLEPSMARMFAVSSEDTVRLYAGNRRHGGLTDEELREAVGRLAAGPPAPRHFTFGRDDVRAFLAERGAKGITISCENSAHLPSAERLAQAIREAYGTRARITRNSPQIQAARPFFGLGGAGQNHSLVETPDILLGNRNDSHYIARYAVTRTYNSTMPVPVMTSTRFPGPGRSIIALTRTFKRQWAPGRPQPDEKVLFTEKPQPATLVIGASDLNGVEDAVSHLIELTKQPPSE